MRRYLESMSGFGFYSALIKIVWGIVFIQSPNLFATAVSYTAMANIASEQTWGILLFTIGILHIWSIFSNSLYFRIGMQSASIFIWLFIATQFWLSNPVGTGKLTYSIAAIIDFIAVIFILKYKIGRYT